MASFDWRKLIGLDGGYKTDSTGLGPDMPGSGGDRERGKFRPSVYPRLTTVAVVGDDGEAIGAGFAGSVEENTLLLRAIVLGLTIITEVDLLQEVTK